MYIIHTLLFCDLHLNFTARMDLMVHMLLVLLLLFIPGYNYSLLISQN